MSTLGSSEYRNIAKKKVKNKHRIITRKVDEKHKHRTLYELNHHIVTR